MNNGIVVLEIWQFAIVYLLLIIVLAILKKCKINQSKLLVLASFRMTIQLILAGLVLTYIFKNPHPVFVIAYITAMIVLATHTVFSRNKGLNKKLKVIVGISLTCTGLLIMVFFICGVVGVSIWNPQYTITIGGMVIGNSMTGISLALKTFNENILAEKARINTLLNIGATPKSILIPFVNRGIETAMMPTLNSMLGMGIISLPGMMTGQILSGTLPTTAILYQIAIMISIATAVSISTFSTLYFGYKTLYNNRNQMIYNEIN